MLCLPYDIKLPLIALRLLLTLDWCEHAIWKRPLYEREKYKEVYDVVENEEPEDDNGEATD